MNIEAGPHHGPKKTGCLKVLGVGCLGFFCVFLIGAAIVYFNYKSITSWMLNYRTEEYLTFSNMDEQHKEAIRVQRDRLLLAFEDGALSEIDMKKAADDIYNAPIFPGFVNILVCSDIAPQAGFSREEILQLRTAMSRMTRAMAEGNLDGDAYMTVIGDIVDRDQKDASRLRSDVSRDDLLALQERANAKADELAVPNELYDFNFAQELDGFVDKVLPQGYEAAPEL